MLQMLRKRLNREDEGFTLIELMVVVLIIAILLAIAIPTFLGARSRAQNRAAESNLRNALTAEKTAYSDQQLYQSATNVQSSEPSLQFVSVAPTGGNTVEVTQLPAANTPGDAVCLLAMSASGTYYGVLDVSNVDSTYATAGTFYGSGGNTIACPTSDPAGVPTGGTGTWATTPTGAGGAGW